MFVGSMSEPATIESGTEIGMYRGNGNTAGVGQTTTASMRFSTGDDVASLEDLLSTIGVTASTVSSSSAPFCPTLNSWPPCTSGSFGGGKQATAATCGANGEDDHTSAFASGFDSVTTLDGVRLRGGGSRCNQLAVPPSTLPTADADVEEFQMPPPSPSAVKVRRDPSTFYVSSSSLSSSSSSSTSSNCDAGIFPPLSGTSVDANQPPSAVSSSSTTDLFPQPSGGWFGGVGSQQQQLHCGDNDDDLAETEDELERLRQSSAVKRSANMTECVPVPSSEHVAEIVGRQGCKIKALRAKTNTYIKTPVRGDDPVFVITGRREDVACARREILSAAEHFSQIRASRRGGPGSSLPPPSCSSTTPLPPVSSIASESSPPPIASKVRTQPSCGGSSPIGAFPPVGASSLMSSTAAAAGGPVSMQITGNLATADRVATQRSPVATSGSDLASSGSAAGHGGHVTVEVRVPVRVVGQVVGPKGATIKRIQAETGTYIVTPSRGTDPVFEIVGCPGNVERARREIESFVTLGCSGVPAGRGGRPTDRFGPGLMTGSGSAALGMFGSHPVANVDQSSDWNKLLAGRGCSSLMAAGLVNHLDVLRAGGTLADVDQQLSGTSVGSLDHQQLATAAAAAVMMKRFCADESAGNGYRKHNMMNRVSGEDLGSALMAQAVAETLQPQHHHHPDYDFSGVTGGILSSMNHNWSVQLPHAPQPTTPKFDTRLGSFDGWNSAQMSDDDVAGLLLGNCTSGLKSDVTISPPSASTLRYGRPSCLFGLGPSYASGTDGGWVDPSVAAQAMQSWFDGNITSSAFKPSLTGISNSTGGSRSPSSSPTNGSVGSPVTSGFPLNQSSSVCLF